MSLRQIVGPYQDMNHSLFLPHSLCYTLFSTQSIVMYMGIFLKIEVKYVAHRAVY